MNKRENTDLLSYMQRKGILSEHMMEKTKRDIDSEQELRHWYKSHGEEISLAELRELCNVVFILQDVVYKAEDMILEEVLVLKQVRKMFQKYGKIKKSDLENFLKEGTLIFDVNNLDNETLVFMDWNHHIILIVDRFNYRNKILNNPILEAKFLDEKDDDISDELYERFFGKTDEGEETADSEESEEDEKELSRYDNDYFALEKEYEELYPEWYK